MDDWSVTSFVKRFPTTSNGGLAQPPAMAMASPQLNFGKKKSNACAHSRSSEARSCWPIWKITWIWNPRSSFLTSNDPVESRANSASPFQAGPKPLEWPLCPRTTELTSQPIPNQDLSLLDGRLQNGKFGFLLLPLGNTTTPEQTSEAIGEITADDSTWSSERPSLATAMGTNRRWCHSGSDPETSTPRPTSDGSLKALKAGLKTSWPPSNFVETMGRSST